MAATVTGIGAVFIIDPAPRLMWNGSASAPVGPYRIDASATMGRRDFVLVQLPEAARKLAVERGYLPAGVPLVKRIAAARGDQVCAGAGRVTINGTVVAALLGADTTGRPLTPWIGCCALGSEEFFVLMRDVPALFDSRYLGPVTCSDIVGLAVPLWTW